MNKFLISLVVIGLSITFYYGFQWWNSTQAVETVSLEEVEGWEETPKKEIHKTEQKKPGPKEEVKKKVKYSNEMDTYVKGQEVGRVVIPQLEKGYKTYWGADHESLKRGVGMYVSKCTTTPDEKRHTVLSGHRETVFTELGDIKKGESIFVEYEGERYEYQVDKTWITSADDRTVIVDKKEPTLTLTTCYPFDFVGNAPDRYIIQSELVNVEEIE